MVLMLVCSSLICSRDRQQILIKTRRYQFRWFRLSQEFRRKIGMVAVLMHHVPRNLTLFLPMVFCRSWKRPAVQLSHSYGEYVFDHSWADAYYSYGSRYFPKLQCRVPFTSVTGPRILVRNTMFRDQVFDNLVSALLELTVKGVEWGSVSLVDAEKRLLANALLDFSNEQFILLSESCIPVYNFPIIYSYLIESTHSFVESYDDPSRYGRGRYSRSMRPDIKLADWRKGSQWFELHRTLAIKVISDTKYYRIFEKYCTPSCYPDEHYIPTFLHMFHGSLNANRTITYVDWSQIAPHPASFSAVNITESFIHSIRNNGTFCSYNLEKTHICYLFARKFDASALERLLNLASKIMGF
ncbi:glycosyltransferase BC10-like isoform X2 [Primulina eburnea]|uniref:glycosyltransferase BC10-like isoform X2 n=1 Tax=Primulina eburnea TaxID=1245227 RepID=UPI003C6C84CC